MLTCLQVRHPLFKADQFAASHVNRENPFDFTDIVFALVELKKGRGRHWAKSHTYQDYSLQFLRIQHKFDDL